MSSTDNLKTKFKSLAPHLNERLTRLWAAAEAIALGRGGITQVSFATGLSPKTIRVGIKELNAESEILPPHVRFQKRIRAIGGGRKPLQDKDPTKIAGSRSIDRTDNSWRSRITFVLDM